MELARDLPGNDESFSKQVEGRIDMSYWTNLVPSRISSFRNHLLPKTFALAGPLLFISLVLFILCWTSLSQPAFRPENGTLIKDVARNGYGELIIHNNWTMDTVAVLTDNKVKPLMAVYIRSKDSYRISKIEDGSYGLYFTVGNLWDAQAKKFRSVLGYYRYNPPLVFQTTETEKDIEYSIFELDLYEAGASNFVPEQFEFPDLG